jgi:glycosyltransferase involved in cell wall biosynthesis
MVMATLAGLFKAKERYDLIYATSPPLFVGGAALAISYLRRIPLVFEVRDLWPESAVAMGELNNPRAILLAEWLEKACYHRARQIVLVTQSIYHRLIERGYPPNKLTLIRNGANVEKFRSQPDAGRSLREILELQNKFIVIYTGIHGLAQGLETVIDAAAKLFSETDIHFLFVGEGPVKQEIVNLAYQRQLTNITFHAEVSRDQIPEFLSAANVALVPLRRLDLFHGALPSKMFDAWACQCPTIVSIDGEARQALVEANAGVYVDPENSDALAVAILQLKNDPALTYQMGLNGRHAVMECYSRETQARQLMALLDRVLQKKA